MDERNTKQTLKMNSEQQLQNYDTDLRSSAAWSRAASVTQKMQFFF